MPQHKYARLLVNADLADHFLTQVLGYIPEKGDNIIAQIVQTEMAMANYDPAYPTLYSTHYRDRNYLNEIQRWQLRFQVVEELFSQTRLPNDDQLRLGYGGAKPVSMVQRKHQAIIVTGLPAAGKSGVSSKLAEQLGAYIIDPDYAKRKLPEFDAYIFGASLVHSESSVLTFGYNKADKPPHFSSLQERCLREGINMIIPRIGYDHLTVMKMAEVLKNHWGYEVHLILVHLDRQKATLRAIERFKKTKRYVPLGLIFDDYANEPLISYYRMRELNKKNPIFASIGKVSTDVPHKQAPIIVGSSKNSPVKLLKNS
jgi:Zeta toxin